ncbi:importin-11 [Lepeophtheirus salmonis]|uniref:Zgc:91897 [Danio rerio] n=1 Tax=Lepeophtheirus salmonis TaxID=72036 RepID=A0A0K2VBN2_LEPSM|nr:importin-11-like [Lepeophtheirus salmonis]
MDFNELSRQTYAALQNASTQNDPELLKSAEDTLRCFEEIPGFHVVLLEVIKDTNGSPVPLRWQAVLYLKNGVDRYWRRVSSLRISDEEKQSLRKGFLELFHEPISPIALQIAVLIGKIARIDVPKEWPELLPALSDRVQSQEPLVQHRALLVLYHTIKSLSTKRLPIDVQTFYDTVEKILPFALRLWEVHHSNFVQQASNSPCDENAVLSSLEKSILSIKVIRKCLVYGIKDLKNNNLAMKFLSSIHTSAKLTLEIRNSRGSCDLLEKYAILYMKIMKDVQECHPFSFIPVLKQSLEFVCSLIFTDQGAPYVFPRFVIFCLNFIKQVLLCTYYRLPETEGEVASQIIQKFFDVASVTEIYKRLISKFLPLSAEDLNLWDRDPEEYACEDGGDSWKYSYRPCCEALFLTFFNQYCDILAPLLTGLAKEVSLSPTLPSDLQGILYKDAVYNAIGLSPFDLYEEIDFDNWLQNCLERELTIGDPNYRIIRRRTAWLIGRWSGVRLSPEMRPKVYRILLPLLRPEEDMVVRLTTCKSLKVIMDDFDFSVDEFEPFCGVVFEELFRLLKEVQECDTKLCVLNVLAYVIERIGVTIRPYCYELLRYLPSLWEDSSAHDMLRCSILSALVHIVQGLGTICEVLLPTFIGPIIQLSTDLKENSHVYLLEDGLELWLTVLNNSKELSSTLSSLALNIPPLLQLGSENLRTILYILSSYVLLSPTKFLHSFGKEINSILTDQIMDLQDEGVLIIYRLVELVIKTCPPSSSSIYYFKSLIVSSLKAIHNASHSYSMLMSCELSILSRLILCYPKEFGDFSIELARELNQPHEKVTGQILDHWLEKMDLMWASEEKKLLALALCSLLTSGSPVVLDRIYMIFLNVTSALNDVTKPDNNGGFVDTLVMSNPCQTDDGDNAEYETEHEARKRRLASCDSVHSVDLREYFQTQLAGLYQQIGQSRYSEMIENIDVETKANMKEFVTI